MKTEIFFDPNKRHDFVYFFDVVDGNPNGDPDAGNLPRVDPETMQGIVTDVCIKRKIRDWIDASRGEESRNKIYIERGSYLADKKKRAYEAVNAKKGDDKKVDEARMWMCSNFFDIRLFGGVLVGKKGEGYNCGQVRGPVQLTFARSIDPVLPIDLAITRVALENSGEKTREDEDEKATHGTMGRKAIVPYGLYVGHGFFSPHFARQTGVDNADLHLFWSAFQNMWDLDRSSSRGMMALRGLYIFSHEDEKGLGNAPAHSLFSRITATARKNPPRKFDDYAVSVNEENLPAGIHLTML